MDYARYNYIAQPGDQNIRFVRQMGPYDHYATNWGYRYIPTANSAKDEKATLDKWIREKEGDPIYYFGRQSSRFDPQSQTEGIGNDPLKASDYGIKNLKYVIQNLPSWTSDKTNDYQDLEELYGELLGVYRRYVGHVVTNVGGVYEDIKMPNQDGQVFTHVDEATQKASVQWLNENAFASPQWLVDASILQNINHAGYFEKIRRIQAGQLNNLLTFDRLGRLIDAETVNTDYYSALNMLIDLRKGLFSEAYATKSVDLYRRNLQRSYIDRMEYLMTDDGPDSRRSRSGFEGRFTYNVSTSDVRPLVRGELKMLRTKLKSARNTGVNIETKYHYDDVIARIDQLLDPK